MEAHFTCIFNFLLAFFDSLDRSFVATTPNVFSVISMLSSHPIMPANFDLSILASFSGLWQEYVFSHAIQFHASHPNTLPST